jgi:hypothetical protein
LVVTNLFNNHISPRRFKGGGLIEVVATNVFNNQMSPRRFKGGGLIEASD